MSRQPKVLFDRTKQGQINVAVTPHAQPSVLFGAAKAQQPKRNTPKILVGGVVRQRIPCTIDDLRRAHPDATVSTLTAALSIIHRVNLDDPYFEDVVRFGEELQIEHGAITETELNIANDSRINDIQMILAQILTAIQALNPERVFNTASASVLQKISHLILPTRTPQALFDDHYPQLARLVEALRTHEPLLSQAEKTLNALQSRYQKLTDALTIQTIAAQFMADYSSQNHARDAQQTHYSAQADALAHRATSLLTTQAILATGQLTHGVLISNIRTLNRTIQSILHEDMPAFHTAYTRALTQSQPIATLLPLQQIYNNLVQHLNPNGGKP